MKSTRATFEFVLLVAASITCAPARAHEAEPMSAAGVLQADPNANSVFRSAVRGVNSNPIRLDGGLQRALSDSVFVGKPLAQATDPRQTTLPSNERAPHGEPDGSWCPSCRAPCPTFYGQVDALFLVREPRLNDQPIIIDPNTDTTFLSTSDLDFNLASGLRATVGLGLCSGRALEFSYFGLFQGSASAFAGSPDADAFLIFPDNFFGNVFVDFDSARVSYSSGLHSAEANLSCCCCNECCCGDQISARSFDWFAGFRYLTLGEELNIDVQRTVDGGVEEGAYDIRTTNHLYGLQLGARLRRSPHRFGWEAVGKAGVFGNDAHQEQSVTDFPDFAIRPTVSSTGSGVAFVGEANLSALCRLTNVWNLRAGYNAMWIEGVALAPDQLDFNFASAPSGDQLHRGGGMFLHGVNIGLEAGW